MAALFRNIVDQILDANADPIPGAQIYFYDAGTTTPKDVYSDSALEAVHEQPVLCDSGGRIPTIFMQASLYKVRVEDDAGSLVRETDNYDPGLGVGASALPVTSGGTGATDAATARDNLGAASQVEVDSLTSAISSTAVVGLVLPYAGNSAPTGWLFCYGQAVSRATYSDLFAAISTTFGIGDGSTTFNLPDIRGRVIAGQDDMGGSSANRLTGASGGIDGDVLGGTGGAETHTLTTPQIPSHEHFAANGSSTQNNVSASNYITTNGVGHSVSYELQGNNTVADRGRTSTTGGGGAHNNVQPTIILNYIIKY